MGGPSPPSAKEDMPCEAPVLSKRGSTRAGIENVLSVLLAVFAAGIALALSALAVYFKDLTYLWAITLQVWFFITPVVYPPSVVEDQLPTWAQNLLRANPMVHFVGGFRDLLYHAQMPGFDRIGAMLASAVVSLVAGWLLFHRLSPRLPEEV